MRTPSIYSCRSTSVCSLVLVFLLSSFFSIKISASSMSDSELAFLPAYQIAEKIRSRELTSERITRIYLQRIKQFNPTLNAIVTLNEEALALARKADTAMEKGIVWGALHGVPITVKDNYSVKGVRSTAGYPPLQNNIPNFDATVVSRLREAGAVILGKTNMPQMGLDAQTYNPLFGVTNNPWDLTRTPGGSSGGCATAVAAGLTAFSVGNDIGGSIRIPAHFTGVYGIKTTENFVSDMGMVRESEGNRTIRHLVSHGPIARSIKDLSLVLEIIAGDGEADYEVPRVVTTPAMSKRSDEIKVAWLDTTEGVYINADTRRSVSEFIARLSKAGISTQKVQPENFSFDHAKQVFDDLLGAEVIAPELSWLERNLLCLLGYGCVITDTNKYFMTLINRDAIAHEVDRLLEVYDVWVLPVASASAHKHRITDNFDGPLPIYEEPLIIEGQPFRVYTDVFNLTGHPVVSIPIGYDKNGLPIGIQIVGKRWYDAELLAIADKLSVIAGSYQQPPDFE